MKRYASMTFIADMDSPNCPCFYRGFRAEAVIKAELEITGLGLYHCVASGAER